LECWPSAFPFPQPSSLLQGRECRFSSSPPCRLFLLLSHILDVRIPPFWRYGTFFSGFFFSSLLVLSLLTSVKGESPALAGSSSLPYDDSALDTRRIFLFSIMLFFRSLRSANRRQQVDLFLGFLGEPKKSDLRAAFVTRFLRKKTPPPPPPPTHPLMLSPDSFSLVTFTSQGKFRSPLALAPSPNWTCRDGLPPLWSDLLVVSLDRLRNSPLVETSLSFCSSRRRNRR